MKKSKILIPSVLTLLTVSSCAGVSAKHYTVTFDTDGGSLVIEQKVEHGKTAHKPDVVPTKVGYTFENWYTSLSGGVVFDFDNTPITQNTVIYAHYTVQKCTVTFETNGGSAVEPVIVEYGNKLTKPTDPTITGGHFAGWYSDKSLTTPFNFDEAIKVNTTLYAKWEMNYYIVEFKNDPVRSITEYEPQLVKHGNRITVPTDPTSKDETITKFAGWYDNKECEGESYDFTKPVTSTMTLYAKWVDKQMVVAFHYDDESKEEYTKYITVDKGTPVSKPTSPEIEGWSLVAWCTDKECTNEYDFTQKVTNHMELFAKWEEIKSTVKFDLNGGTGKIISQTILYGKTVSKPEDPTRSGYQFVNWYTEKECINVFDFNTPIYNDLTLYAGWGFTVTFNTSGVSEEQFNSQLVVENQFATFPGVPTPSNPNLNCYGWKLGEEYFEFSTTPITKDIILTPATVESWISIEGERNLDVSNNSGYSFSALINDYDVTSSVQWSVLSGSESILRVENNKFYPVNGTKGGSAYIQAEVNYEGQMYYGIYSVEVSSLNKLKTEKLKSGVASMANTSISGNLIIPSRYYVDDHWKYITSIEKEGFYHCSDLNGFVKIPYTIETIGDGAFRCFTYQGYEANGQITQVIFEDDARLEVIESEAFDGQRKLTSIHIPSSVLQIGAGAFYEALNTAFFDDQENTWNLVQDSAFGDKTAIWEPGTRTPQQAASDLKYISPSGLSDFHWYKNGTKGITYTYDETSQGYIVSKVDPSAIPTKVMIPELFNDGKNGTHEVIGLSEAAFKDCVNLSFISLPKTITKIPGGAFIQCGVKAQEFVISLKSTITEIGQEAFAGCTSLKSITLPNGLQKIGNAAFIGCSNLNYVDLFDNNSLETIGDSAFANTALTMVTIPASVKSIGTSAFQTTPGIRYAYFKDPDGWTAGGEEINPEVLRNPESAVIFLTGGVALLKK